MIAKIVYICKYCNEEYSDKKMCEACEKKHNKIYTDQENKVLAEALLHLKSISFAYHVDECVLGMPIKSFNNLMEESAKRLTSIDEE